MVKNKAEAALKADASLEGIAATHQ